MGTGISKIYGEMSEIIEPKVGNPQNSVGQEMSHFEPPLKPAFFEDEIFQFFFFNHMPQEYLNEKLPILNDKKKPKTLGKLQNIRNLEGGWTDLQFKQHPALFIRPNKFYT